MLAMSTPLLCWTEEQYVVVVVVVRAAVVVVDRVGARSRELATANYRCLTILFNSLY